MTTLSFFRGLRCLGLSHTTHRAFKPWWRLFLSHYGASRVWDLTRGPHNSSLAAGMQHSLGITSVYEKNNHRHKERQLAMIARCVSSYVLRIEPHVSLCFSLFLSLSLCFSISLSLYKYRYKHTHGGFYIVLNAEISSNNAPSDPFNIAIC